jgi:hypothetical protein
MATQNPSPPYFQNTQITCSPRSRSEAKSQLAGPLNEGSFDCNLTKSALSANYRNPDTTDFYPKYGLQGHLVTWSDNPCQLASSPAIGNSARILSIERRNDRQANINYENAGRDSSCKQ